MLQLTAQASGGITVIDGFKDVPNKPVRKSPAFMWKVVPVGGAVPSRKLDAPELCVDFWHTILAANPWMDCTKEHLVTLMLNTRYHVDGYNVASIGTINESIAHPRDVIRPAIVAGSYAFVVMHNHPSGDCSPSQTDHSLTRRLTEGAELMQVKMLDHVIVANQTGASFVSEGNHQRYFSFEEAGVL